MNLSKSKGFYLFCSLSCIIASLWILINKADHKSTNELGSICLIKNVTGVPCPACGSTRSVLEIINLELGNAFVLNPLGFLVFAILLVTPIWIAYDIITKNNSLYSFYVRRINIVQPFYLKLLFVGFITINWLWNIIKGL